MSREFKASSTKLHVVDFKQLDSEDSMALEAQFSEKEIKNAIGIVMGTKVSTPSEYNFNFLKECWDNFESGHHCFSYMSSTLMLYCQMQ